MALETLVQYFPFFSKTGEDFIQFLYFWGWFIICTNRSKRLCFKLLRMFIFAFDKKVCISLKEWVNELMPTLESLAFTSNGMRWSYS